MPLYRNALLGKQDSKLTVFISSLEEDKLIVNEVLEVLIAHVKHLKSRELIPSDVASRVLDELSKLLRNSDALFKNIYEDVHEAIEVHLKEALGSDAEWVPLGRSRNDHVAAALRLKARRVLLTISDELLRLRELLLMKARKYVEVPFPAFTHLQPAQVTTIAHYLTHVEEMLRIYTHLIYYLVSEVINKSPLGSAAAVGTVVPVDREELAKLLGFNGFVVNTLLATSSRDFAVLTASTLAALSVSISRIAEDFIIWSTPQYGYVIVHSKHLSTSSIMPHKKNLVTMEVLRAWGGEAVGHLTAILSIIKGLPSGYNLDLQEVNKHLLTLLTGTLEGIAVFRDFVECVEFDVVKIREDLIKYPLTLTELAELISMELRRPYREVHREVASVIRDVGSEDLSRVCTALSERLGADLSSICINLNPDRVLRLRKQVGSPNPEIMIKYIDDSEHVIRNDREIYLNLCKEVAENVCP